MPFSAAYQITEDCIFDCDICHRRYMHDRNSLDPATRRQMVATLKRYGLKRLTVTGGEPVLLGDELFDFLKFVHSLEIHTCLSTTGYKINLNRVIELDGFLDQLLLPIRSLNIKDWEHDFGKAKQCAETLETVINILEWIKKTNIILTISTVVHKNNVKNIINLGWKLYKLNPNIVWSIDEYYPMGKKEHLRNQFELDATEAHAIRKQINQIFGHKFKHISFNDAKSRAIAPDYLITPAADLVTTSNYRYSKPIPSINVLKNSQAPSFENRRSWVYYQHLCRDWGWNNSSNSMKETTGVKKKHTIHAHHIAIQTANFEKALNFYHEILGFPIAKEPFIFKERKLAWLNAGNIMIELYSVKNNKEPQPYNSCRVGTDHIAFEVNDLDEMIIHLEERGSRILKRPFLPPTNDPLQPRVAFIEGTDGEEIELREAVCAIGGTDGQ